MLIEVITAFPSMVSAPIQESIVKRALSNDLVHINIHDLRDWTTDKHKTIDDAPYGGGAGMIYKVEPLYNCLNDLHSGAPHEHETIILLSPRGKVFDQSEAVKLSLLDRIILICGRYKGVDERIMSFFSITELSIGDYILTGGEVASLVIIETVVRLIPGAIKDIDSAMTDSFADNLLDCDYYTRPETFRGVSVPKILLSGDHKKITEWRLKRKEKITRINRPDLYKKYNQNK
jgi:tRNA (guanine37-N1)-methyltransferase